MACNIAYLPINCDRVMDSCANLSLLYRSFTKLAVKKSVVMDKTSSGTRSEMTWSVRTYMQE